MHAYRGKHGDIWPGPNGSTSALWPSPASTRGQRCQCAAATAALPTLITHARWILAESTEGLVLFQNISLSDTGTLRQALEAVQGFCGKPSLARVYAAINSRGQSRP
jgi:hypothetical protein